MTWGLLEFPSMTHTYLILRIMDDLSQHVFIIVT